MPGEGGFSSQEERLSDALEEAFDLEVGTAAFPATLAVQVEAGDWESMGGASLPALIAEAVRAALTDGDPAGLDLPEATPLDISLVLTDDAHIQALNRAWRDKDSPTNVLSFAALDADEPLPPAGAPVLLGDILVAQETVAREAAAAGLPVADHLFHLLVHGVLHLLGHDHIDDEEAEMMESLETAILTARGMKDPHALRGDAAEGEGS